MAGGVLGQCIFGSFFFGAADKLETALKRLKQEPDVLILCMSKVFLHSDVVISRDNDAFLQAITPAIIRYAVDPVAFVRQLAMVVRRLAEEGTHPHRPIRLMPKFLPGETA